ncbi:MAG TPA: hypothetical protein VII57_08385 [Dehalococcoidia bacterium]
MKIAHTSQRGRRFLDRRGKASHGSRVNSGRAFFFHQVGGFAHGSRAIRR